MRKILFFSLLMVYVFSPLAYASGPFVPNQSDYVIGKASPYKQQAANGPSFKQQLSHIKYILSNARQSGDPTLYGRAKSQLLKLQKTYPNDSSASTAWHFLHAKIIGHEHEFTAAIKQLTDIQNKTRKQQPYFLETTLELVTLYTVTGQYPAAELQCGRLFGLVDTLILTTCLSKVRSLSGQLKQSYELLKNTIRPHLSNPTSHTTHLGWSFRVLAEMAARSNDQTAAQKYYIQALQAQPSFNLALEYAAWLNHQQQYNASLQLLKNKTLTTATALQLWMAHMGLQQTEQARPFGTVLQTTVAIAEQTQNISHSREIASYLLATGAYEQALFFAQQNVTKLLQHEPIDILLLLKAAKLSQNEAAAQPALDFIKRSRIEHDSFTQWLPSL